MMLPSSDDLKEHASWVWSVRHAVLLPSGFRGSPEPPLCRLSPLCCYDRRHRLGLMNNRSLFLSPGGLISKVKEPTDSAPREVRLPVCLLVASEVGGRARQHALWGSGLGTSSIVGLLPSPNPNHLPRAPLQTPLY